MPLISRALVSPALVSEPGLPVLLLLADTGGGHRSAALAVAEALRREGPGRFAPVLLDPLGGPDSPRSRQRAVRLYGPLTRRAPWAWGALYRATDSRSMVRLLSFLRFADRPVIDAVTRLKPGVIVSLHPLTTAAAVRAAGRGPDRTPVVTVITDLVTVHAAWPHNHAERVVVASPASRECCALRGVDSDRCVELGLPVAEAFAQCPPRAGGGPFRVVVTGGGEGSGGIVRQVSALIDRFTDIEVTALCGRNQRARETLEELAKRSAGRLTVHGLLPGIADQLRWADVVVTKAGPGTIAEAACCGAAMLLTSRLPGQEEGNVHLVVQAGAGRYVPRTADMLEEIGRLRADPAALSAMRAASSGLARPRAAAETAALIAELAGTAS